MKAIQLANTTKASDVNNRYILLLRRKKQEKNDDFCSPDDVRAARGSQCTVLLPFSMGA